jgi:hypothetical protein
MRKAMAACPSIEPEYKSNSIDGAKSAVSPFALGNKHPGPAGVRDFPLQRLETAPEQAARSGSRSSVSEGADRARRATRSEPQILRVEQGRVRAPLRQRPIELL